MRKQCDSTEWTPSAAEVEQLSLFGTEQQAIVAIGYADNIASWQVGRAAGFSGGTTTDQGKRRANWASVASKATKLNRKILPHIAALMERLVQFRSDGGSPSSISWKDKLVRCEWLILHGTPSESLRAIELHTRMKGVGDSTPTANKIVSSLVARVGFDDAREGLRLLGAGHLIFLVPELDPVKADAIALEAQSGASVDFEDRLELPLSAQ